MPDSQLPDSPVSIETEQPSVTDSNQVQQQPQKPKKKRPWSLILGIILLVVGGGLGWRWWQNSLANNPSQGAGAASKPMGIPVKLATVETGTIQETTELVGSLEAPRSVAL